MPNSVLRFSRLVATLAVSAGLAAPAQLLVIAAAPNRRSALPRLFHKSFLWGAGVRKVIHGEPAAGRVIFVANHMSWSDIPLLGSIIGGIFVAKAEVGRWPVVGALAKIHGILFVDREQTRSAGGQAAEIADELKRGHAIILFPEGTTSEGDQVLPFKSSLFSAADSVDDAVIQPVTLAYTQAGRRPITPEQRRDIAWTGDDLLVPQMLKMLRMGRVTAEVMFHPPVRRSDFLDRKALARHCHQVVADGLAGLQAAAVNRSE